MKRGSERDDLERKLAAGVARTCRRYGLLEADDRVMVAVSGGKDSYTLLHLLMRLRARLPFRIDLVAVHLDQRQPNYDGRPLEDWLERAEIPFEILAEDTYSVVKQHIAEGETYCSLCSRLRRGILYTAAERLGCNKIALGHHRDDSLETFLMNLVHAGKLQAMPAVYTTDDGRFRVIRPLIECAEKTIARFAELEAFPIIPCNLCGSQSGLEREEMAALIAAIEAKHPHVREIMASALRNVRPTHLLDRDVLEAWNARAPHIRSAPPRAPRPAHAPALPRRSFRAALPVLAESATTSTCVAAARRDDSDP